MKPNYRVDVYERIRARLKAQPSEPVRRRACAWCGVELRPGVEPTSHGICDPCNAHWLACALTTCPICGYEYNPAHWATCPACAIGHERPDVSEAETGRESP